MSATLHDASLFTGSHMPGWQFGDLVPFSYDFLMIDPPWAFELRSEKGEGKSAQAHYDCMSLDDIKALRVGDLVSSDCVVLLWATSPMLPQALEVLAAWGLPYTSLGWWDKRTTGGKRAFGTGYRMRSASEPFVISVRGSPNTSRRHRNVIQGKTRAHSQKPEAAYHWAETYLPGARRAELFSRTDRPGWDTWGREAGKFNGAEKAA